MPTRWRVWQNWKWLTRSRFAPKSRFLQASVMTYRIAHFSDFHLANLNLDFERSLMLVDDAADQEADHLMLTGDLVESGQMPIVAAFVEALKHRGWAGSDKLTIIPGNHDIFPFSKRALPTLRRPTAIFEEFVTLTRRSRKGRNVTKLVRGEPFPFGKILTKDVVLVGLDTTRTGQYNPFRWAEGELPEHHREAASEFLAANSKAKHRIVAMHHHPWFENLEGNNWIEQNFTTPPPDEIEAWLRKSAATLVLCGHVHAEDGVEKRRLGKKCVAFRAGTAGGVDDAYEDGDKKRIYHLIDLESNGKVRVTPREFWDSEL